MGWDRAGARTGAELGFDTAVLVDAVERQQEIEAAVAAQPSADALLTVTEPTGTATAAAFAHTAVLAGRPRNAAPLAEAGRFFGRLAHLLDAVEDLAADERAGVWNPVAATGRSTAEVRRLSDDAVHGVRLALRDVEFTDGSLVHALLAHELQRSVDRVFGTGCSHTPYRPPSGMPPGAPPGSPGPPEPPRGGRQHGLLAGCALWAGLCCTCQVCCSAEYENPCTGRRNRGCCRRSCDCSGCSDCCSCCNCGGEDGDGGCCDCCDCDCGC